MPLINHIRIEEIMENNQLKFYDQIDRKKQLYDITR